MHLQIFQSAILPDIIGINCSLEYLQMQVTTLVSLLLITMIFIDSNNYIILVCLLFYNFFWCAQLLINFLKKSIYQYASYSLIFTPLHNVINGEQREKHLYKQSSHYRKHRMFNRQNACPIIDLKVEMSPGHSASLCFEHIG